jgi:DNA-binding NtrC family response regulator
VPQPTLLIVDDDRLVRKMLADALRQAFRVLTAEDGPGALEILECEPVDIVISDHFMPGMSGAELLARVATRWPDTLRILTSGAPDPTMAVRAVNLGEVFRILVKPIERDELQLVLLLAMERLRLERENRVFRALVERHPEIHAQFTSEMARRWPALAPDGAEDPAADLAASPAA